VIYFKRLKANHCYVQDIIGIPYNYNNGPREIGGCIDIGIDGVNCVFVAHYLCRLFHNIILPVDLDPVQVLLDNIYLRSINLHDRLKCGDIFFFAKPGISEFRVIPNEILDDEKLWVHV
jgi:hypothetical protein